MSPENPEIAVLPNPIPTPPSLTETERGKRFLGYLFSGVLFIFVAIFLYFVVFVVGPMTRPTSYFEQLTVSLKEHAGTAGKPDPMSVDLGVMLEYASADIRMAGVQIAFALVGGLFFAIIGVLLLAADITGVLKLGAKSSVGQFSLSSATPGFACLTFGAVIVGMGVMRNVSRPMQSEISRPVGVTFQAGKVKIPDPPRVENSVPALDRAESEAAKNKPGAINMP